MHNKLGSEGEELASAWLVEKGYRILFRNWRYSYYEIDIVAVKGKVLHIIEIKTRNESHFGFPEDSVTRKKFRHLQKAADEFLFRHPGYRWIQFDILSITIRKGKGAEYFLLEDIFL